MNQWVSAFIPNKAISKTTAKTIIVVQVTIFVLLWAFSPFVLLPTIGETWRSLCEQWQQGLGGELLTSLFANLEAIGISAILSLGLSYLTTMEGFKPAISIIGKFRFLSMVGLSFMFTVVTSSARQLKLSLLIFSISVFFVTSMMDVVASIPKEQYDLARTLGFGPWRTVYEVVVLGQFDKAFDCLRQNAAIGWMMLTMVETMVRSEGGVGTVLADSYKHFHMASVMAIQMVILLLGLVQDYCLGAIKIGCCPFASLALEKK